MGRRGPPPKPTALRLAQGNPGRLKINKSEPQPAAGIPGCPDWLSADAKACWAETAGLLSAMRVLTLADRNALAGYCDSYSKWKKATEWINERGMFYPLWDTKPSSPGANDGVLRCAVPWPQVTIAEREKKNMLRFSQEFGLTPASRSRINAGSPLADEPADKIGKFLSYRGGKTG